jgi:hypothetical protein
MIKKILVAGLVAGALGYALRDKIAEGLTKLEGKLLDWVAEDPTPDDEPERNPGWDERVFRGTAPAPVPDLGDSFPVGKRHDEA